MKATAIRRGMLDVCSRKSSDLAFGLVPGSPHAVRDEGCLKRSIIEGLGNSSMGAWLGVLGICLLFVVLRWNSHNVPLVRDEGEYAYAAQLLRHGLVPYRDAFLQK